MRIKFNPTPSEQGSGTTAFIPFTAPEFIEAIEKISRKRPTETIDQIEIDRIGITVRLSTQNHELDKIL